MKETTHKELTIDEWNELSDGLVDYHNIFYRFWTVCRPEFSDKIKTAAVAFDKNGDCIQFLLNYDFWQQQSLPQKLFIISHECQHLILNHGKRGKRIFAKGEVERLKADIAMDVCVNEGLVARYGFDRSEVDPTNKYVWADKVGAELGIPNFPTDRCFEYYYNLFKQAPDAPFLPTPTGGPAGVGETVDEHTDASEDDEELGSQTLEKLDQEIDQGERESLENMMRDERNTIQNDHGIEVTGFQAGRDPLGHTYKIKMEDVKPKKKWETIIQKWTSKCVTVDVKDDEQWAKTARRFALLDRTLSLPFDMEIEAFSKSKKKIDVWFFLDTSGSCIHLASRFFNAASSLPPKRFNVHLYCFDTKVYPSDLKKQSVKGGGGTSFEIIEKYIVKETLDKGLAYPDAVFVMTDGGGDAVSPKKPGNWFWLMSHMHLQYVPPGSKVFSLREFE